MLNTLNICMYTYIHIYVFFLFLFFSPALALVHVHENWEILDSRESSVGEQYLFSAPPSTCKYVNRFCLFYYLRARQGLPHILILEYLLPAPTNLYRRPILPSAKTIFHAWPPHLDAYYYIIRLHHTTTSYYYIILPHHTTSYYYIIRLHHTTTSYYHIIPPHHTTTSYYYIILPHHTTTWYYYIILRMPHRTRAIVIFSHAHVGICVRHTCKA